MTLRDLRFFAALPLAVLLDFGTWVLSRADATVCRFANDTDEEGR